MLRDELGLGRSCLRLIQQNAIFRFTNVARFTDVGRLAGMFCLAGICGIAACPATSALAQQKSPAGQPASTLLPGGTVYPRVVRLSHGSESTRGRLIASTDGVIFQSTDDGRTFTRISTVPVRTGSKRICCSTLYELPRTVGTLTAGTLLSAGTYARSKDGKSTPAVNVTDFLEAEPAAEIYRSTDAGLTWQYLGSPVFGGPKLPTAKPATQRGLWEPEFTLSADGALVMFVSDETDPCCSQKLTRIRTYDGAHWQDRSDVIRSPNPAGRPGMIVVSGSLPTHHYFLTYELCGAGEGCTVYSRSSKDGWTFGEATAPGTKVISTTGQYFQHSPSNTYRSSVSRPATRAVEPHPTGSALDASSGQLIVIGQMLYEPDGTVSPQNGRVFFTSTNLDGTGPWTTQAAPVPVPTAYDNFCPNYSSALLPSRDGSSILELASDYDSTHHCVTHFQSGTLR